VFPTRHKAPDALRSHVTGDAAPWIANAPATVLSGVAARGRDRPWMLAELGEFWSDGPGH